MPKLTFWYSTDGLKEQRTKNRYAQCSFLFDCQKSINAIIAWWKLTNSPSLRLKEKDHLVHIGSLALQPPWPRNSLSLFYRPWNDEMSSQLQSQIIIWNLELLDWELQHRNLIVTKLKIIETQQKLVFLKKCLKLKVIANPYLPKKIRLISVLLISFIYT